MVYRKGDDAMWDFSPLLIGLVGVVWFSAGMIVWATLHHYLARPLEISEAEVVGKAPPFAEALREAA